MNIFYTLNKNKELDLQFFYLFFVAEENTKKTKTSLIMHRYGAHIILP